jgi:hypothetical protein
MTTATDQLAAMDRAIDTAFRYGVHEDNNIAFAEYDHNSVDYSEGDVPLSDPDLIRIDRIRLLTDRGCPFFDVSYVYGTLRDGRHVRVDLGAWQLPRKGLRRELVRLAAEAGRYGKGLGMLDDSTLSILWG